MTNTTTPVESIGAPTGAASFYRWEVAGKPIAILFSLDLMDRLEREVLESFKAVTKRGSEIGGVLGGRVVAGSQPTVIVEQFEPVECDYSRGPLYLLSDEDKVRMKQALERVARPGGGASVAGFFRSNTRRELVLDEEDQSVAKEFFSDPNNVFLLVRPFAMKPSAGAFFFWEGGQLPEESYQQFPFKRAELVKSFSQFIVAAPEPPVVREPLVMPRREERPVAPPVTMKREEPRPAPVAPPRREEAPPPPPPPAMRREEPKREEPAPAPPPPVFKREEPKASVPPPVFKREEQKPAPPPRREEAPPVNFRRDAPPPVMRREERPPIVPVTPRPPERPSGPTLVSRREEQAAPPAPPRREEKQQAAPPPPPVTAKREERPPVVVKREEKPVAPPVVARREEPAPPKVEEKPVVAKPPEAVVVAAPPKKEEPVKVEQVKVEPPKAEPVKVEPVKPEPVKAAPPKVAPVVAAPVERIPVAAAETAEPSAFARFKWVIVALVVVLLLGGGTFVYMRSSGTVAPAKTADTLLGLKVETNAGQLLLSWNRNATSVATATRATLTINDGDHKEDVDLDLATLHNGSIVYSPISNDVSFRLEVADQKTGKSEAGSVRRLAGRPSAAVAASVPQQMQQQPSKQTQAPNEQRPTQPAQTAAAPQPPPAPVVSAGPAVTKEPVKQDSLASRLRAAEPAEIPAAPALDSQPNQLAQNVPNVPGTAVAPPPPSAAQAQQRQTQTQAAAAPPKATSPAPAPVTTTGARIGGQAQEARVLKRFPAVYPLIARTSHISGIVRVHAIIGKNGRVRKATALSGPQILRAAAVESVMKWVYSPAILDGEPVEAETQVDVNFQM